MNRPVGRPKRPNPTIRCNLVLNQSTYDLIKIIMTEQHFSTVEETIRRSVVVYDTLIKMEEENKKIILMDKDNKYTLLKILGA